jgi:SAM-dependent methyltransferase
MRAAVAALLSASMPDDAIYLTEFVTHLYQVVASKRQRTIGSEYLRDGTARGERNAAGVRHEDATCLSFPDAAFNIIGTFDVLEHVPNYRQALAEFFRCLRPGLSSSDSAVFSLVAKNHHARHYGCVGDNHPLLPPEIHGDPIDQGGALCSYHFGWDFLDGMTTVGFQDPGLSLFWDPRLGYLGSYQFIIAARKAVSTPRPLTSARAQL